MRISSISCINKEGVSSTLLRLLCLSLVLLNISCSALNSAPHDRVRMSERSAFTTAALDQKTWIPAAAALLIAATDTDHSISDWATEHNPVFGSQSSAEDASNQLRAILGASALVTSVVAPGQQDALLPGRTGNLITAAASAFTISELTNSLKESSGRTRPNGVDQRSFPSSHTAAATTYATISAYRVNELSISAGKRQALNAGLYTLAAATAWARVEAKAHYPVDVLTGFALGNFTTRWLHETLQTPRNPVWISFDLDRNNDKFQMFVGFNF